VRAEGVEVEIGRLGARGVEQVADARAQLLPGGQNFFKVGAIACAPPSPVAPSMSISL
jgi:hypothetical protein